MEYMKKLKWFNLADYLEEETYLEEQHKKGWEMTKLKAPFSIYTFKKCEPEDYVYQLDFKREDQDTEEYIQLFEDCGWDYFYKFGNWYYFRKKKSEVENENVIFNDAASRAQMAKKIIKFQAGLLCTTFLPGLAIMINFFGNDSKRSLFFSALIVVYFLVVAVLAIVHTKNFWKLNKLIRNEKEV